MRSAVSVLPPAEIGLYWTDEQLVLHLEQIILGFFTLQNGNVTGDINPYEHLPSNLPDIWCFIRSEQKKASEHGFWKARGEACEIFANSNIIGWRTTLEFYEGRAPHERRTNWLMQEYSITQKQLHSNSNPKESGLLCRVFSSGASPNREMKQKLGGAEIAGGNNFHPNRPVVPDTGSTTGPIRMTESEARRNRDDNTIPLAAAGTSNILVENIPDMDYILSGDFLELDDLGDPESRSSFSDNSSCLTLTSEECFDYLALGDLEDPINQDEQGKDADVKFNVAASVKPNEVVMRPATLESLVSNNGRKSPTKALDKKLLDKRVTKGGNVNEGTSLVGSNGRKLPTKALDKKLPDKRVTKNAIKTQKAGNGNEGTSLVGSNGRKLLTKALDKKLPDKRVTKNAIKTKKAGNGNERTSNSHNLAKSSKSNKAVPVPETHPKKVPVPEGKKNPLVGMMKKLKKYLCCFPF
ncbi:NAC domain-containing protein 78 [Camellia lanceoleosa]|uniref:NAC domain-containing protein 78 n=1 Tax=Camellia lanceoleosa TaxID=1840588 RepID=A0ACC0HMJ8_9ERIC|nr:NAC domain-containing protein 78 [Camellia lanceoleosa]